MTQLIDKNEAALSAHEAVCAERYAGINARLKRIEQILVGSVGFIMATMITLLVKLN
jgi:hypothetical protein